MRYQSRLRHHPPLERSMLLNRTGAWGYIYLYSNLSAFELNEQSHIKAHKIHSMFGILSVRTA